MKKYYSAASTIDEDDITAVAEVLRSGHLEEGEWVRNLEFQVAQLLGKSFAQATVNGFSSIHTLLLSLNLSEGDEVIIPAYCCPAVLYPIKLIGAIPVFADIGENSFNMSLKSIEPCVSTRTKVILYPYQFGFPGEIDNIKEQFSNCIVIEDVAQAFGATYKGKLLGSFTDYTVASFYASKMLTSGDGGMVLTNNAQTYDRCKVYTYYGGRRGKQALGFNYHLTNLNAALGLSQLSKLQIFVSKRKALAKIYDEYLKGNQNIFIQFDGREDACYLKYPILLESRKIRDELKLRLQEKNIYCGYGVLEGLHQKEEVKDVYLPNTEQYLDRVLCLPIYPSMKESEALFIAETTLHILNGR